MGGVILHAPFLSVYRVVIDTGCTVYGDKFPNIDFAPMIDSPVILVHGKSDQIVPFHHSERLFKALSPNCRAKPLFIDGMGHNNVHAEVRPMFVDRLSEFLSQNIQPAGGYKGPRRPLQASKGKRSSRTSRSEAEESYGQRQIAWDPISTHCAWQRPTFAYGCLSVVKMPFCTISAWRLGRSNIWLIVSISLCQALLKQTTYLCTSQSQLLPYSTKHKCQGLLKKSFVKLNF